MFATEDIAEGEQVAMIPQSLMVTFQDVQHRCKLWSKITAIGLDLTGELRLRTDYLMLTLHLLQEKRNPFSLQYSWLQAQTSNFDTNMIYYTEEELAEFTGSQLLDNIKAT